MTATTITTGHARSFVIEYHCTVHGTIRETVNEGQRNTALRYGFDCRECGAPCAATQTGDTPAIT